MMKVYLSAADEDFALAKELEKHLQSSLAPQTLRFFGRHRPLPGAVAAEVSAAQLAAADVVLLLISADALVCEPCQQEHEQALRRHRERQAEVVALVVRPVVWEETALYQLPRLPREQDPVLLWQSRDAAWETIVRALAPHLAAAVSVSAIEVERPFFARMAEIERLMDGPPTDQTVTRFHTLVKDPALRAHAFGTLLRMDWLAPLERNGFFATPAQPEAMYLRRTAEQEPWLVARVAQRWVAAAVQPLLRRELAETALVLPAELSQSLVPGLVTWLAERDGNGEADPVLSLVLTDLVNHLLRGGQSGAALELLAALLALQPAPGQRPRVDLSSFEEALAKTRPVLRDHAPVEGLRLLLDCLEEVVRRSAALGAQPPEDGTQWHRPAIEEHEQNTSRGELLDLLLSTCRTLLEERVQLERGCVAELVALLDARPFRLFHRLALHLLRLFPVAPLVAQHLTDRAALESPSLWHEYTLLLRVGFPSLTAADQARILAMIEAGPSGVARPPHSQEWWAAVWQRDHYARLGPALPLAAHERKQALIAQVGPPRAWIDFIGYTTSGEDFFPGNPSAPPLAALRALGVAGFLKSLRGRDQPSPLFIGFPEDDMGRALADWVREAPTEFAREALQFQDLDRGYVAIFLNGLQEAASGLKFNSAGPAHQAMRSRFAGFSWDALLSLSLLLAEHGDADGQRVHACHSLMLSLLRLLRDHGLAAGALEIPLSLRALVFPIIERLLHQDYPQTEVGSAEVEPMHALDRAINTVPGAALEAVIAYARWVARCEGGGDGRIPGLATEVQRALDFALRPRPRAAQPSEQVQAILASQLGALWQLDCSWTRAHLSAWFGPVAWGVFLRTHGPHSLWWSELRDYYERAVDALRGEGSPSVMEQRLAAHLAALYESGHLPLAAVDGVLRRFYARASDDLSAHFMRCLLRPGPQRDADELALPVEVQQRLQALWDWRITEIEQTPAAHSRELAAFGWWFAAGALEPGWTLAHLSRVLSLASHLEAARQVWEQAATLSEQLPARALACLDAAAGAREPRGPLLPRRVEPVRAVLRSALLSREPALPAQATALIDRLGALRFDDFRDLLADPELLAAPVYRHVAFAPRLLQQLQAEGLRLTQVRKTGAERCWLLQVQVPAALRSHLALAAELLVVVKAGEINADDVEAAAQVLECADSRLDRDLLVLVDDQRALVSRTEQIVAWAGQRVAWSFLPSHGPSRQIPPLQVTLEQGLWRSTTDLFDQDAPLRGSQLRGRREEVARLRRHLERGESVAVLGAGKVGKTSLVRAVTDEMDPLSVLPSLPARAQQPPPDMPGPGADEGQRTHVLWLDAQRLHDRTLSGLVRSVWGALRAHPACRSIAAGGTLEELEQALRRLLLRGARLRLVIDEYDLLFQSLLGEPPIPNIERFFAMLREIQQKQPGFSLIVIGRGWERDLLLPLRMNIQHLPLGPLNPDDASDLLRHLGLRVGLRCGAKTCEEAWRWTGGHPLLHRQLGSTLLELARARSSGATLCDTDDFCGEAIARFLERDVISRECGEIADLLARQRPELARRVQRVLVGSISIESLPLRDRAILQILGVVVRQSLAQDEREQGDPSVEPALVVPEVFRHFATSSGFAREDIAA